MKPADALAYRRLANELAQEHLRALGQPSVDELNADQKLLDDLSLHTIIRNLPTDKVFFVSADMTMLATAAAASVPEITRTETTLVEPHGFMVFESPIAEVIGYVESGPDKHRMIEECHSRIAADGRVITPIQGFIWQSISSDDLPKRRFVYAWLAWVRHDTLYPLDWTTYAFDVPVGEDNDALVGDELEVADLEKRLWVAHILMQQTLAWTESVHPDRHERRRWQRAGLPVSNVNVVKMRRLEKAHENDTEASIAWSHRWLVNGHWRQQWYPSTSEHKPMWISPHVKGPPDKPFVAKDRVIAWVR